MTERRERITWLLLAAGLLGAAGCGGGDDGPAATGDGNSGAGASAAPWFDEVSARVGADLVYRCGHDQAYYMPEVVGGGVALFDMDDDGDLDLYLVQSGSLVGSAVEATNRLLRNRGDGTFEDVSAGSGADDAGYGMGVACGDYDGDGDVDLFVANFGADVLLRNDGGGRFTDVTAAAGVADPGWGSSAAFLDYDGDGDLDLFVVNYLEWAVESEIECYNPGGARDYCAPHNYDAPTSDLLYRNDGGRFTDVSASAGIRRGTGNGLGVAIGDFNGDDRPDIAVANDKTPDRLWINQGDGAFVDDAPRLGCALDNSGVAKAGMGINAIDIDDDGDLDFIVGNLTGETDSFYRNDGSFFTDVTLPAGLGTVSRTLTRFGMAFVDFDNDGVLDLYQASGRVMRHETTWSDDPYAEPNLLYRGRPGTRFEEVLPRGGTAELLVGTSRGAAFGDIDNDGRVDIVVVNRDAPLHVLRNVVPAAGNWIRFRVTERGRDALLADVEITAGGRTIHRGVQVAYSYMSSNDPRVHFGLGEAERVTAVTVRWPDGVREVFGDFDAGRDHVLRRGAGRPGG